MAIDIRQDSPAKPIHYPDSDGQPMSDNTLQFDWIQRIKGGLDAVFALDDNVFVGGDLLWYPVEGRPDIRVAPDALVAFGRPKGYRGSYKQWEEANIAPQVVFEVLSPGNRAGEMLNKFLFYDRYGVEEYYIYNPDTLDFSVILRQGERLVPVVVSDSFTSPRLGVRFELPKDGNELAIYRPDGRRFLSYIEMEAEHRAAEERAVSEAERAERLAARLREMGIDPDTV